MLGLFFSFHNVLSSTKKDETAVNGPAAGFLKCPIHIC